MLIFYMTLQAQIKANHSKCEFSHSHVKTLGHVMGSGELCVDPDKVSAVADWANLETLKGFSSFLDLLIITIILYLYLHV